jgi:HEPN/Toprim N-terminal domain 1
MSSWCSLTVDGFSVYGSPSYIDDVMLSVFQERDRRVRPAPSNRGDEDDYFHYEYAISAQAMRERLDTLGFTAERARTDYTVGHAEYVEMVEAEDFLSEAQRENMRRNTYDYWCAAIGRLVPQGFQRWDKDKWSHDPDAEMIAQDGEWGLGAHFSDIRLLQRGVLDALASAAEVVLDYSALVSSGYYAEDERVCAESKLRWAEDQPAYGPIVLLTEGKSDTRILSAALEALVPHLADLFSFLDFDELRLEGGVGALAKTVRAFAGARVSGRMVAVFDNDTAGAEAHASLGNFPLPANIRTIMLPPSSVGSNYPTTGPQGLAYMDVNSMACSIELYLGRDALSDEAGNLRPVRWMGWNRKMERYQGEVEGKAQVEQRFFDILANCASPSDARTAFPDLAAVVDAITAVFTHWRQMPRPGRRRNEPYY